jgi:tetratricopeptide (TPR) repeat protein
MPFPSPTCFSILSASTALLACAALAHDDPASLGEIDFPVSCSSDAQHAVTEGTLLLHHMMYDQAQEKYEAAAAGDPACAMAQWGIAMSQFHPMWPGGQSDAALATGVEAMARAGDLDPGTARERAYLDAAAAVYDKADAPYPERIAAWSTAQQKVFDENPDDIDAGALAGLAMLAVAAPSDQSFAIQREAGAVLEALHERAPTHPGVFHYAIHAYDQPPLAPMAERFAEGYDQLAPNVPHALHMPSHIFVRVGRWPEVAAWNERSAAAALAQPMAGGATSGHYAHAIDYQVYALLQMGDAETARLRVADLLSTAKLEDDFGSAYAVSAAPARVALEQEDWAAAAALPVGAHDSLDWSRYPQALAISWFAKGLGAARSGDAAGAGVALEELATLRETMAAQGMNYWVTLADAQSGAMQAWVAFHAGQSDEALQQMREAADLEDKVGKSPVTPGHVLPARELLGDLLGELGRTEEARAAYETALAASPNRRRSLDGMAIGDVADSN